MTTNNDVSILTCNFNLSLRENVTFLCHQIAAFSQRTLELFETSLYGKSIRTVFE